MKYFNLLLLVFCLPLHGGKVAIYNSIEIDDQSGSSAVAYAAKALQRDFDLKFGTTTAEHAPIQITLRLDPRLGIESFDQYTRQIKPGHITITGTGELGLIHGIYSFSEDVLGIDPFIYFTDIVPETVDSIEVEIGTVESKPYTYPHRIFFINDEDLVSGFQMEKVAYGFNLDFMEKLYETMLRLKMTGVIPSTLVLPDEPHLKLASDMGLYIAQHHAEPVGSVPLYWPKNVPYSWSTHRETFIRFWRTAIERQAGKNVIWTLNFRGLLDRKFWEDDPNVSSESSLEARASVINEVIQAQYDLIREVTGDPAPLVCGYLWGELNDFHNNGLLKFPEGTILLFSDDGRGVFREGTWESAERTDLPKGVYQHVSYHNRRGFIRINSIHPDVLHREMTRAIDSGLTEMIVLNVGNFKEKTFGVRQMVNYMNDFESYRQHGSGDYYFGYYAREMFDSDDSGLIQTYRDFFANQLKQRPDRPLGDEWYSYYLETALRAAYEKDSRYFERNRMGAELERAEGKWTVSMQRALEAEGQLRGSRRNFYHADLVLPTKKMLHLNGMATDFTRSLNSYREQDYHAAQLAAYAALKHLEEALQVEQAIEKIGFGKFRDWYRWDQTAYTKEMRGYLENYLAHLKDLKFFSLPYDQRNSKTQSIEYKNQPWFDSAYQEELIYMENAQ